MYPTSKGSVNTVLLRPVPGKADMAWYLTRMKSVEEEQGTLVHISRQVAPGASLAAAVREGILIMRDLAQKGLMSDSLDQVNLVQDMTITGTRRDDGDKFVVHLVPQNGGFVWELS